MADPTTKEYWLNEADKGIQVALGMLSTALTQGSTSSNPTPPPAQSGNVSALQKYLPYLALAAAGVGIVFILAKR